MKEQIEKVKEHVKKHKVAYSCLGTGIVVAGITYFIMRERCSSQHISVGIASDAAQGGIVAVLGKNAVINNVSYISSRRKGSPSWVIRCLETGEIFTSQKAAALAMNIPQSELSQHLNGLRNYVRGYTFERICMAA
jgi:hypothetical protein